MEAKFENVFIGNITSIAVKPIDLFCDLHFTQEVASLGGQLVSFVPAVELWCGSTVGAFYFYASDGLTRRRGGAHSCSLQNPIKNIIQRPT